MADEPYVEPRFRISGSTGGGGADPDSAREVTLQQVLEALLNPAGTVEVSNLPVTQPVSGSVSVSNLPATQPVSGTVTANVGTGTQPVSGTVTANAGTGPFPVSDNGGSLTVDGSVSVSNFPGTQPVSGTVAVSNLPATQAVSGTVSVNNFPASPSAYDVSPATLAVTATAAAGQAVTATLPAVAGQFHYITAIQIVAYATAAKTGSATPVVVITTNLPGSPAFTFPTAMAIGTVLEQKFEFAVPLKSSVANTATTIVAPVNATAIWRINVTYRTGA
jgi:hypothetical protein